jgi:hypothetical protein
MDAQIKAKWLEALRSGKFKQGFGQLQKDDAYCCLGVLCVAASLKINRAGEAVLGGEGYSPFHKLLGDEAMTYRLYRMNDSDEKSFPEIADYIEANL